MSSRRLLIIEDDPGLQKQMRWCFEDMEVFAAGDYRQAETLLRKEEPQVVTLDLGLPPDPGGTRIGFDCLDLVQRLLPATKVIVVTGREERESALAAIGRGAYDFYQKPIDSQTLQFVVERAFRLRSLEEENLRLRRQEPTAPLPGFITADERMLDLCRQVERVAPVDVNVMILGETGTGKEIIARNLHALSDRADAPFVAINCAAIPDTLLESELFGHEKGAFTGASQRKKGRIETAGGGTLFLDEVGDMPLSLQAKILRFLQERTFERVGGNDPISVDVRVIAATHRDLQEMIAQSGFREDLYYRLSEICLTLPPLRERGNDSVLIAAQLLNNASEGRVHLSHEAQAAIRHHPWPGNIRELENRIKRAAILSEGHAITPQDLQLIGGPAAADMPLNLKSVRARAESAAVEAALAHTGCNISQAARILGISRPTLYSLLEKYDIDPGKSA